VGVCGVRVVCCSFVVVVVVVVVLYSWFALLVVTVLVESGRWMSCDWEGDAIKDIRRWESVVLCLVALLFLSRQAADSLSNNLGNVWCNSVIDFELLNFAYFGFWNHKWKSTFPFYFSISLMSRFFVL
jgi:hypothetical protein